VVVDDDLDDAILQSEDVPEALCPYELLEEMKNLLGRLVPGVGDSARSRSPPG